MKSKYSSKVFEIVKKIPKGKVMTYKQVAQEAGVASSRVVGRILHTNQDSNNIPCHRVVRSDGKLASGYAFGGMLAQKKRLANEGVLFRNNKIDLEAYLLK